MTRAISVRLDDEAMQALARLEASGKTRSEAIRAALVHAAQKLNDKEALAAEVAALEADEQDRTEMLAVAELMEGLRASG
ncbi:MAG: ribbon-helix-helix protein, CopG family [Acidimicrobiia bacterium]